MYAVYSSTAERPVIRDWYPSEKEAEEAIPDFRRADTQANGKEEERYFVVELADVEVEFYRAGGFKGSKE